MTSCRRLCRFSASTGLRLYIEDFMWTFALGLHLGSLIVLTPLDSVVCQVWLPDRLELCSLNRAWSWSWPLAECKWWFWAGLRWLSRPYLLSRLRGSGLRHHNDIDGAVVGVRALQFRWLAPGLAVGWSTVEWISAFNNFLHPWPRILTN
jgi:hypothetical protein